MFLFHAAKKGLINLNIFRTSRIYYQRSFEDPTLCVIPTQKVGASAILITDCRRLKCMNLV
jgi:hypothetical protein